MAVTLRDVARHAGVSVRTVSNVVNDFPYVAAATRERVQQSLAELGYRPNLVARNLRRGRSGMIALVLPELDVPYFSELTRLIIEAARRRHHTVVVDQTDGDPDEERRLVLASGRDHMFDGLIFSPLALSGDDLRTRDEAGPPVVLLGEHIDAAPYDHIAIDNVAAARAATTHLIEVGRRRVAALGDQPFLSGETAQYRTAGYREAHAAAGRPVDPDLIVATPHFHRADGAEAMTTLLDLPDPPDAVFCYNDLLAFGAIRTLLSRGLRVPDDVAVVGFDGTEEGRYTTPTLTTVAPDKAQIAELAVDTLLARLAGADMPVQKLTPPYRLEVRESTAGTVRDLTREGHPDRVRTL